MSASTDWALILGASSGFGGATAKELAKSGFDIFGVHLDRATTMPMAEQVMASVRAQGREAVFFNVNAADAGKRAQVLDDIQERLDGGSVRVVLHSLAFGTLRPYVADAPGGDVTQKQIDMTLDVMANSLVYWTQGPGPPRTHRRWRPRLRHDQRGGHAHLAQLRPRLRRQGRA